jgi:uncharacterized membrane protein
MTKTRLEAFSDAVIAIIITIMVLEMKIPHEASWHALAGIWEIFISYALSFFMLAIYWGNHHHMVHTIKEVNSGIIWANLHLLFWLSLIPFATGWMGENEFDEIPVIVYALLSAACGIAYFILLVVIKKSNSHNTVLLEILGKQSRKGKISVLVYMAICVPIAFINGIISFVLLLLVGLFWLIPDRNIERSFKE